MVDMTTKIESKKKMTRKKRRMKRLLNGTLKVWLYSCSASIALYSLNFIPGSLLIFVLLGLPIIFLIVCSLVLPDTGTPPGFRDDWYEQHDDQRRGTFDYLNPLNISNDEWPNRQSDRNDDRHAALVESAIDHSSHVIVYDISSSGAYCPMGNGTISSGLNDW
jgi:hypothetical protein